jgi:uncharacterized protein (DUF1697 family)
MPTYVALLRALNVGGRYYKMADLRQHLTESGLAEVETHIQTGNVVLRTPMRSAAKVEAHVERVLAEHCGFEVPAVVLSPHELRSIHDDARGLPAPAFAGGEQQRRYVTFFKPGDAPTGEVAERVAAWDEPGEAAWVLGRAVHVWIDKSSLDARFYKTFKKALAPGTARDLKVVAAMTERWGA